MTDHSVSNLNGQELTQNTTDIGSAPAENSVIRGTRIAHFVMVALATFAMALGAGTMFALQPMIGKLLAPWLGSVPAVWTTCMLFFQMMLLAGYVYVHWLTRFLDLRKQLTLHALLTALAAATLPLALPEFMTSNIPEDGFHAGWIFVTLVLTAGAPAFVLSSTAPLVQAWFGTTTHELARNPYPLYIASNTGSLLGLISYPFLVEPHLSLTAQRSLWSLSWTFYAVLLGIVALLCWRHQRQVAPSTQLTEHDDELPRWVIPSQTHSHQSDEILIDAWSERSESAGIFGQECDETGATSRGAAQKLKWMALSFVPSSLLLGATSHMTTDIAAMPLLWTIPLAIYLLSWTVSFTDSLAWLHRGIRWLTPLAVIAAAFVWAADFREQTRLVLAVHLATLLTVCWTLHRCLYESRPDASRLTSFYIGIALGGALGGIFNALLAPLIFSGFAEYPLALVLALMLLPSARFKVGDSNKKTWAIWQQCVLLSLALISTAALSKYAHQSVWWNVWNLESLATRLGWTTDQLGKWAEFALPLVPALLLFGRPRLQAAATCTAMLVGIWINHSSNILMRERSFFGVLTVKEYSQDWLVHTLVHGGIMHGEQRVATLTDRLEPRSYYHKDGPLGDVMDIMAQKKDSFSTAAIGLGTGSVAAYGQPHRPITFFEIDPAVEAIARNPKYFTYLSDCIQRGCPLDVRIGDARVTISRARDIFDVIIVDAFSSDSIPLHLITREAIEGWFRRLQLDGVITFHVSNRYLDLIQVLANAAASMGAAALVREDIEGDKASGRSGSSWVVLTADPETAQWFTARESWNAAPTRANLAVWTDDFASVLPVIKF